MEGMVTVKVTNKLRMAAIRAQRDGKSTVALVVGSTASKYNVKLVELAEIINCPIGSGLTSDTTVWIDRSAYGMLDGIVPGHRVLLGVYGTQTIEQAKEEARDLSELLASLKAKAATGTITNEQFAQAAREFAQE